MNDKEQKLYGRIKKVVSTTVAEYNLTYGDIENALIRVYEETHSEDASKKAITITPSQTEVKTEVKKTPVDKQTYNREKAKSYYHQHRDEILAQRRAERGNGKRSNRSFRFTPQVIEIMSQHQDEMPIEVSQRVKRELGVDVSASSISNWRYNQGRKKALAKSQRSQRSAIAEPVDSNTVSNYFQK